MKHGCLLVGMALAATLCAQTEKKTPEQLKASYEAHKGDFDYLLGDWQFTADSKEYGKFEGRWSAVRLDSGGILDEYRVLEDNGDTVFASTTIRAYNAVADRWELIGTDGTRGLLDFGTAKLAGKEMHIEQRFGVANGNPATMRIRYYNIRPEGFSWVADRSTDGGKTWEKESQKIEARRIGPPRDLGRLTPAKRR